MNKSAKPETCYLAGQFYDGKGNNQPLNLKVGNKCTMFYDMYHTCQSKMT